MKKVKTRGSGKYTESEFWSMIRSTLRRKSMYWPPITETLNQAKRKYTGENKRLKFEYKCSKCNEYHPRKDVNVDHVIEVGSLKSGDDLKQFVNNLFAEVGAYQILCKNCHYKKTFKKE